MSQLKYNRLNEVIRKNGFTYSLIKRNDYKAIYQQEFEGKILGYEVLLLTSKKISKPESHAFFKEIFPGNESFGLTAWSMKKYDKAIDFYETLLPTNKTSQLELKF